MNNMNNYDFLKEEQKNQTLVLVEGKHEKKTLLSILLECFPEVPILCDNIHVYEADIYDLYHDIEEEYEEDWYENDLEIDIPLLISRRHSIEPQLKKNNFTNIILIFDYEHHDPWFKDEKIERMQRHFNSMSDDGILFINYPMIEAYKHILSIPDEDYLERYVSVKCQPGREYKQLVKENSVISKYFDAYDDLLRYLRGKMKDVEKEDIRKLAYNIFSIREKEVLQENISNLLMEHKIEDKIRVNMEYSIMDRVLSLRYLDEEVNYWEKLRQIVIYIVTINIEKAFKVQKDVEETTNSLKRKYLDIDWTRILDKQNVSSRNPETGIIWVLCTCLTFIADYKFFWRLCE